MLLPDGAPSSYALPLDWIEMRAFLTFTDKTLVIGIVPFGGFPDKGSAADAK